MGTELLKISEPGQLDPTKCGQLNGPGHLPCQARADYKLRIHLEAMPVFDVYSCRPHALEQLAGDPTSLVESKRLHKGVPFLEAWRPEMTEQVHR